jgi:hypothetical protein
MLLQAQVKSVTRLLDRSGGIKFGRCLSMQEKGTPMWSLSSVDIASKDCQNRTLLYVAAQNGKGNVARTLISRNEVREQRMRGRQPFWRLLQGRERPM